MVLESKLKGEVQEKSCAKVCDPDAANNESMECNPPLAANTPKDDIERSESLKLSRTQLIIH